MRQEAGGLAHPGERSTAAHGFVPEVPPWDSLPTLRSLGNVFETDLILFLKRGFFSVSFVLREFL